MPNLYIIAGSNGAGKTTASFTVLPEMLDCHEFVNADEIARGLSPLNPEKPLIESGRLMLTKIEKLISTGQDFAFETTLASKTYVKMIQKAKLANYHITLVFFWLDSTKLAIERVKTRVREGGHNIAEPIIIRRYFKGLKNLFRLYMPVCDFWMIFDNSKLPSELIAEGYTNKIISIKKQDIFDSIKMVALNEEKK